MACIAFAYLFRKIYLTRTQMKATNSSTNCAIIVVINIYLENRFYLFFLRNYRDNEWNNAMQLFDPISQDQTLRLVSV